MGRTSPVRKRRPPTGKAAVSTLAEALRIAQSVLDEQIQPGIPLELVLAGPVEYDTCWVVGWNSRRWIEQGSLSDAIVGGGPIIINRRTGAVRLGVSALPAEQQLDSE